MTTRKRTFLQLVFFLIVGLTSVQLAAQTNPLWTQQKVKNYLPHMTVPEVEALLEKTDMVIIPIASLEQHGNHLPIGTDFINGVERCDGNEYHDNEKKNIFTIGIFSDCWPDLRAIGRPNQSSVDAAES